MNRLLAALLTTLLVAGCATKSKQDFEVKFRHRVRIAMYDPAPHAKLDHVDVYDEVHAISKPHRDIALVTCEGTAAEESPITEAIIYRAQMIGADAVIILPVSRMGHGEKRTFRAKAVVYENQQ